MGGNGEWAGIAASQNSITLVPRRVPSDYADKVKAKVVANLVRPDGAVYKAQAGEKADARSMLRQCTIPYEITVDREGKVLSFQIESCGDKLLDAAAEAALQKSGPFPPPPHAGAATYVIYGSANFRAQ
jgi:protein TonB